MSDTDEAEAARQELATWAAAWSTVYEGSPTFAPPQQARVTAARHVIEVARERYPGLGDFLDAVQRHNELDLGLSMARDAEVPRSLQWALQGEVQEAERDIQRIVNAVETDADMKRLMDGLTVLAGKASNHPA